MGILHVCVVEKRDRFWTFSSMQIEILSKSSQRKMKRIAVGMFKKEGRVEIAFVVFERETCTFYVFKRKITLHGLY